MSTKHTEGKWQIIYNKYSKEPKKVITGIGVELEPGYFEIICNSILPETDKEYIKQHKKIEADMKLIAAASELLIALKQAIKEITETDWDVCGYSQGQIDKWNLLIKSVS